MILIGHCSIFQPTLSKFISLWEEQLELGEGAAARTWFRLVSGLIFEDMGMAGWKTYMDT
jgi:hypothetical protein